MRGAAGWIALAVLGPGLAAQTGRIEFAEPVKLVSCEPASPVPCFRMKLNLVDAKGAPLGVSLPASDKLAGAIRVRIGDTEATPFYAAAAGESTVHTRRRVGLVLVDISGSMNRTLPTGQTRFDAAKQAVRTFLRGFEEGSDWIAVVPFESHQVQQRIQAAAFASTKADALAQVEALPQPEPKNNTAIYSSIVFGLDAIQAELPKAQAGSAEPVESMIILLTDGSNEVLRGDDIGLLAGPSGLAQAEASVGAAGIPVIAIAFGDTAAIDEAALKRISRKYYLATDSAALQQIFADTRTLLNNRLTATVSSPYQDRSSLAGQTLPFHVALTLPDGKVLESAEQGWSAPQMGVPVFAGKCSPEEARAVLTALPPRTGWNSIIRPVGVFCGLGLLLMVLWFWAPRLIWPEQYVGPLPGAGQAKWSMTTVRVKDGVFAGRPAPPGFEGGIKGVQMAPRGPAEPTVLNPSAYLNQTRLANREAGERRSP